MIPRGNRLRWRGWGIAAGATTLLVLLIAKASVWRLGVPLGVVLVLVATVGVLDGLGTFDDPDDDRVVARPRWSELARPMAELLASLLAGFFLVSLAVAGLLPTWLSAVAIPAAAIGAVIAVGRLLERLGVLGPDEDGTQRPLHRRHGAWLLAIAAALYLPALGSHGLVDPWETHYGEVAREILARDDWISLWWAQDGWFFSKPVLLFWVQAMSMATFGVRTGAGAMLSAAAEGRSPWPEWALRMPIAVLAILALYLLYRAVARSHGRRAGFLGAMALATMPQWFLIGHQTITDMPFVATLTGSLALFLLGLAEDPDREVRLIEVSVPLAGRLRLGAHHLALGVVIATVLPQLALLIGQNLWFGDRWPPLRVVIDTFSAGSPGNCGLPGNDPCRAFSATFPRLQPALQALLWMQALAVVLWVSWGERRTRRLFFLGAWWCAAIATMAKGVGGLALPLTCMGLLVLTTRRWRDLLTLEVPAGALIWIATVLPWVVAMIARHGFTFVDKLLFDHMIKRAFGHVHDTNAGDDVSFRYYVWQLGYATFPWVGIAPTALLVWLRRGRTSEGDDRDPAAVTTETLLALWFLVAFALFAFMETKFHHYILPALPPLGALTGIALDRLIAVDRERGPSAGYARASAAIGAVLGAALVLLVARDIAIDRAGEPGQARLMHLFTYNYERAWPGAIDLRSAFIAFAALAAVATGAALGPRLARASVVGLTAVAVAFAAFCLDVYFVRASGHWGQRDLVLRWIEARAHEPGPLVAYQLNWKGENFYTGNQLPTFVSSGRPFREWLASQRRKGVRTFYFLSLPDRTDTLAAEVGLPPRSNAVEALSTPRDNDKFVLVRVRFPHSTLAPAPLDG